LAQGIELTALMDMVYQQDAIDNIIIITIIIIITQDYTADKAIGPGEL
jgi:hypothetical protein